MKPYVEISKQSLAESEQQTKQLMIKQSVRHFQRRKKFLIGRRVSLFAIALPYAITFVTYGDQNQFA